LKKNVFLNTSYVLALKEKYLKNPNEDEVNRIWLPFMFQMWWKKWME
jgi:hypothetical protein